MWYINDDRSLTPHLIGIDAVASVLAVSWLPKMFRCNCGPDVLVVLDSRGCIQVFEESFSCSDLKFRKRDRFPLKTCSAASPERPLSYGISWTYITRSLSVQTRSTIAKQSTRPRQSLLADVFLHGCGHDVTKPEIFCDFEWNNQILVGCAGGYLQAWLFVHKPPNALNEQPLSIREITLSQPSCEPAPVTSLCTENAAFMYACASGMVARECLSGRLTV